MKLNVSGGTNGTYKSAPILTIFDNASSQTPTFKLYTDDADVCQNLMPLVFPLEPRKEAEPPTFITGKQMVKKVEGLDLITTLEPEQLTVLQSKQSGYFVLHMKMPQSGLVRRNNLL